MRFTNKLIGTIASLLLAGACTETGSTSSSLSGTNDGGVQSGDCTLTQGYWKNHESAWPVASLELGSVSYTKAELIAILKTPVKGNGLISLAHQLIAAKLNVAAGATGGTSIIASADAKIGALVVGKDRLDTSAVSDLVGQLDDFNSGKSGPGHCGDGPSCSNDHDGDGHCDGSGGDDDDDEGDDDHDCDGGVPPAPVCGNGVLEDGEGCDDGNVVNHDGCSAVCQVEVPVCGNGIVETGEECDDGNTTSGDGCSSACVCDCPHP